MDTHKRAELLRPLIKKEGNETKKTQSLYLKLKITHRLILNETDTLTFFREIYKLSSHQD